METARANVHPTAGANIQRTARVYIHPTARVNVHPVERNISILLGGMLLFRSIKRNSLWGTVLSVPLLYRGISGHSYLYQALGIAKSKRGENELSDGTIEVARSITIEKPAIELYRFWQESKNLAQIMPDFVELTPINAERIHWQVHAPFARNIEWNTQVVEARPGEILRWKSLDGGILPEGIVSFHPAPRDWGTETRLHLRFSVPGGMLGRWMAMRVGIIPGKFADKALRRFKSLVETGEVPTLKDNPAARPDAYTNDSLLKTLRRAS